MGNFITIDEMELFKIDGGEACNMNDVMKDVAETISDWIKGLFD